uniref:Peptidase_M24 domain-containing protein n=1 Tax=Globodera pallida TaxID=36090 RepID=A0A183BY83_GLOPA
MQSNSEVRKGGEWIVRDRMARASPTPLGCFVNGDFKHAQQQQQELECDGEERADQSGWLTKTKFPKHVHIASSPVQPIKMVKNASELEGMRKSHIRDSAALVKFFHWLRNEVALGHLVDENRAARQCHYYREQLELFVSPSFETISAVDEHAAIPHYHMDEESGKKLIGPDSVYLLDSGGQYRDGTTDVTRTVCFAEKPDERFRRMFTLVFKSHVQCAMAKFPDGTYAMNLDGVTRAPLWAHGYDFEHGVGHGVGHFLNVHEFPPYIGYRVQYKHNSLRKGVVVTIEPGYYEQGAFGIRFENCYELVEAKGLEAARLGVVASASSSGSFITFAPLTFVPVQKSLLLRELLEQREIDWLNHYHNQCLEAVGRYLQEKGMQEEYNFLAEACTPERECGETPASKLRRVSTMLRKAKCDSLVLSQLDEIAWLFNLRGSDIPFNPVFFAYAFVTVSEKAFLFVDLRKMSADVAAHLKQNNGVEMFEYADIFGFLKQYHQNRLKDVHPERHRIWLPDCLNPPHPINADPPPPKLASLPVPLPIPHFFFLPFFVIFTFI